MDWRTGGRKARVDMVAQALNLHESTCDWWKSEQPSPTRQPTKWRTKKRYLFWLVLQSIPLTMSPAILYLVTTISCAGVASWSSLSAMLEFTWFPNAVPRDGGNEFTVSKGDNSDRNVYVHCFNPCALPRTNTFYYSERIFFNHWDKFWHPNLLTLTYQSVRGSLNFKKIPRDAAESFARGIWMWFQLYDKVIKICHVTVKL